MQRYIAKRLFQTIPVLILTSILVFYLLFQLPGDPVAFMLGDRGTPNQVTAIRNRLGLEDPLPVQYFRWLGRMVQLDFGDSLINDFPVTKLLKRRFPATLQLSIGSFIVAALVGFPVGIAAAVFQRSWLSRFLASFNAVALAMPVFWLGMLLALLIGVQLKLLPPSGYVQFTEDPIESIRLMILPSITLGLGIGAILARFLQASLLDVFHQDFIRTARAKGLSPWAVLFRHVLKNAMIPVVTVLGLQFGSIMGGAVITEAVFNIPGLGNMLWIAILRRDYFVIQSLMMIVLLTLIFVNLVTDIVYAFLDPRIRYS